MKKQLLFLVAILATLCINAQVTWHSVDLALGADEVAFKGIENGGPESVELEDLTVIFEGQTDWLFKTVEEDPITFDYNGNTYNKAQVQGATNGMDGHLTHANGPSCAVHFIPAVNGTIDITFKFGYNKKFFVAALTEDDLDEADFSTDMSAYAYDAEKYWGHFIDATTYEYYIPDVDAEGKAVPRDDNPDSPHYTGATIDVEAGKEYYVWFAGSKIMLAGFIFTPEEEEVVDPGTNIEIGWNAVNLALEADAVAFKGIENGGPESVDLEDLTVIFEGQTDWLFKTVEEDPITFDYNGNTYNKVQVQGATNGMDGHLTHANGPSCAVHFIPAVNGTIDIAFKFGYNKKFFVAALTEDDLDEADFSTDMSAYAYDAEKYWGHFIDATTYEYYIPDVDAEGKAVPRDDNPDSPHYTGATIEVEVGKDYYVWFAGSKIMLCGFVFTPSNDPGNGVSADIIKSKATVVSTEYYNMMGAKLSEPANGVTIIRHKMSDGTIRTSKGIFIK